MKKIVIFLLFIFIAGCATVTTGRPVDQNAVSKIKRGETTKEQVLFLMGTPDIISEVNEKTVFTYHYSNVHGYIGNMVSQYQMVTIIFDDKDKVVQITNTRGTSDLTQRSAPE